MDCSFRRRGVQIYSFTGVSRAKYISTISTSGRWINGHAMADLYIENYVVPPIHE